MQVFDVAMAVAAGVTLGLVLAQVESDAKHASRRAWRPMVAASGVLTLAYAGMNDHWVFAGCLILGYAIELLRRGIWPVDLEDGKSADDTRVTAAQSED